MFKAELPEVSPNIRGGKREYRRASEPNSCIITTQQPKYKTS